MQRARTPAAPRQRGAIAIVVALSMVVLFGFLGLAVDGGHLYLTKTELQNGADSCALAAAYELTDAPAITPAAFARAEAAGRSLGQRNNVDFQGGAIAGADITVEYGASLLAGAAWFSAAAGPAANSRYVRCTVQKTGITPYFMQMLGIGNQTVRAVATATLAPSQTNCAVPMALCVQPGGTAANNFGYNVGQWVGLDFAQSGGNANYTGNFRWIDFDPGATTPGCPGGGAQELSCMVAGTGQCNLPQPILGGCAANGNNTDPGCVGQNGAINSIEQAYNSRFGLYKGSYSASTAPMDFSGYSYRIGTWTLGSNAYAGSVAGQLNFKQSRTAFSQTQGVYVPGGGYSNATSAQHQTGADRRLVIVSIVDCTGFTGGQHAPIRGYACTLMLDPYDRVGSNVISKLEFLGLSSMPGSPCASSGVAGNANSEGPLVPSLVQ